MRLLLDTQIAVWAIQDSAKLPAGARVLMEKPGTQAAVSAVSIWEIAIKQALGHGPPSGINFSGHAASSYFLRRASSCCRSLTNMRPP